MTPETIDVLVVGAGQAGVAMSEHLSAQGIEHLVLERAGEIGARPEHAIGVQSLRGGDSAGEHSVYFLGGGERLELHHRASSRDHPGPPRAAGAG